MCPRLRRSTRCSTAAGESRRRTARAGSWRTAELGSRRPADLAFPAAGTATPTAKVGRRYDHAVAVAYQVELITQWIRRGREFDDPIDRFLSLWIAFNAYLGARYPGIDRDDRLVDQFVQDVSERLRLAQLQDPVFQQTFNDLRLLSPPVYNERAGRSLPVRGDRPGTAYAALYAVRNNLFHGSKSIDADRDRQVVRIAAALLDRTLVQFVEPELAEPFPEFTGPLRLVG
jgi:hypothetical protein